ncbi:hypothetical protein R1sor_000728 [Riccia sorocarpa]|uniref:Uncharacterized protein n=1 Tax=Riccia sorocarpa TaxID=122646 RepID=A0ABD3GY46_9MARC
MKRPNHSTVVYNRRNIHKLVRDSDIGSVFGNLDSNKLQSQFSKGKVLMLTHYNNRDMIRKAKEVFREYFPESFATTGMPTRASAFPKNFVKLVYVAVVLDVPVDFEKPATSKGLASRASTSTVKKKKNVEVEEEDSCSSETNSDSALEDFKRRAAKISKKLDFGSVSKKDIKKYKKIVRRAGPGEEVKLESPHPPSEVLDIKEDLP